MARSGAVLNRYSRVSPLLPNRYRSWTLLATYAQGLSTVDAHWIRRTRSTAFILSASASVPQFTKLTAWTLSRSPSTVALQQSSNQ